MPSATTANLIGSPADVRDYQSEQTYKYDRGLVTMPVAGAVPGRKIIRLHGGYGTRIVEWTASRAGKPPVIPALADTGRDVVLGGDVTTVLPVPTGNGPGFLWRVSGRYEFAQYEPRVAGTHTIVAGSYPYGIVPNDAVANAICGPGRAAISGLDPDVDDLPDAFAKAQAESVNTADEKYVWPFTYLPPVFTNDQILGG